MKVRPPPRGRVRIIGGEWRRRWLDVPAGTQVRPSSDRVRETLFNWLQPLLPGARCLDLFAGSGVLGLEALSRGAAAAVLVERDPVVVTCLRSNTARLGAAAVEIVAADAREYLTHGPPEAFDIVFLDPPFASGLLEQVAPLLCGGWIAPGGVVYLEEPRENSLLALPDGWRIMRSGETRQISFRLVTAGP